MTPTEFELALDRWGADFARWPARDAEHARILLVTDPRARRLLAAAREVDECLDEWRDHTAPEGLAGRITARVRDYPDRLEQMLGWLTARLWRPALLAMLITIAGYLTGITVDEPVDPELAEDVMTLAFSDIYSELEDAQP